MLIWCIFGDENHNCHSYIFNKPPQNDRGQIIFRFRTILKNWQIPVFRYFLDISYSGCAPEHHLAEIPESFGLFEKFGFRFLILSSYVWLFLLFFMFVWSPYRTDNIFKWATHVMSRDASSLQSVVSCDPARD